MSSSSLNLSSNPRITPLPDLLKLLKPFSPDKIFELSDMLEDRERAITKEWEYLEKEWHSIKEECRILERLHRLANLDKKKFEENLIRSERECEELKQKITRLIEDEKFSSDRAKKAEERCDKVYDEISVITNEKNRVISELNKAEERRVQVYEELSVITNEKNRVISELNKAEERCVKVYEELSVTTTEKNKVICELNKNIGMLNNLILERDQIIEMYQLKLMYFEEKVGPIERELEELKSQKSAVDQTMKEMRSKQSEADQMVEELKRKNIEASETIEGLNRKKMSYDQRMEEMKREKSEADKEIEQLRCQNFEASETIGELRRQMIGVEMEKTRYEKTIKEMKQKLSEADQTVDLLRRSNTEAFETMGELKRQRMEVEEVAELNTKKLESLSPIIMRMKEGLANILNVEVQDMINIIKSNERSNAIPRSNGEKQNLGNSIMHACNVSLKKGSTNLPPQYSRIKEGNANESNSTDQGKECQRLEESDCIEVICIDDETSPGGSELCAIVCGKEKIGEKFPLTSFALKRKSRDKKWLLGADMLNDFQEDEELCMNVVCVLYRQQISASESSTQDLDGGLSLSDALSVRALGEYLLDGGHGLRLGKTVCEVKQDRPDVLVECRRLATNYYNKLFRIYCNGEDPFFKLIKLYNNL